MTGDAVLDEYDYTTDDVLRTALHDADRASVKTMLAYGREVNGFGRQMTAHQNRVARDGARFLRHLGFSARAAANFRAAMLFHDIGKTHDMYRPAIWMQKERPSPQDKALQKQHARLGADMLANFTTHNDILRNHPHIAARHAVTLYHHERLDGRGPEGLPAAGLPLFVQVSCIVDAYDGDRIYRAHQERQRTPRETLDRMAGQGDRKYEGAFDEKLLAEYTAYKLA